MILGATTAPLDRLLDQVEDRLASSGTRGHVARVEPGKSGTLQFELVLGDDCRWYRWDEQELMELKAAEDSKIPLAARLRDTTFAAGISVLSYRPRRRLTLLDRSGGKPRIIKGFRRGHLPSMIEKYETAHTAFSAGGVHAPDIIDYDHDHESLVMSCLTGERLRLSADTTDLFHHAGDALRGFQDHESAPFGPAFELADELKVIDKRASRLERVAGRFPDGWPDLRERLEDTRSRVPSPALGLAHRDLHDKQFVQHVSHLTLLDFDLMCRADVTLDPANFLAHLVLRNLQGVQGATQRGIDTCGKKFLQGLARNDEPGFWDRLRFYQATSFCRLALVYALRPGWSQLVPQLVTMGNRCLDDLYRIQRR